MRSTEEAQHNAVATSTAASSSRVPLDERKQRILRAICTEHIARAEPVGSELIAAQYALGVRSATLRNEMAEMTEMGYLRQPHTSAGRVPSDYGYRFYVDRLITWETPGPRERGAVRRLRKLLHEQVDQVLREACHVVAELTRYTSIATPPIVGESRLESVRLLALDSRRLLLVLVLESGRLAHQTVEAPNGDADRVALQTVERLLNDVLAGKTCAELSAAIDFSSAPPPVQPLLERLAAAAADRLRPSQSEDLVVEGEVNAIREPEFQDIGRLDRLLELLHSRKAIYDMIGRVGPRSPYAVVIGSENGYEPAKECSFVAARYSIGGSFAGAIGVLGPTRMRYSQAVPVVRMVAAQVSDVLTTFMGS